MLDSTAGWLALLGALVVLICIDLLAVRGRAMSVKAAALASGAWVAIALAFFGVVLAVGTSHQAESFIAGYLVEKSLSLDNVFVFLLIFGAFGVPEDERHRLLTIAIVVALVLRGLFIVVGAAALHALDWLSIPFALLLIWTGARMWRHRQGHDAEEKLVGRLAERLPGGKGAGGALAGLVAVDVLFAVDSVPAILAITADTFIVFAANAFALLGLRPLFFLTADLVRRLVHLKAALAAVLVFIGLKLGAQPIFGKLGPESSLPIVAGILAVGVVASLLSRRDGAGAQPARPGYEPAELIDS